MATKVTIGDGMTVWQRVIWNEFNGLSLIILMLCPAQFVLPFDDPRKRIVQWALAAGLFVFTLMRLLRRFAATTLGNNAALALAVDMQSPAGLVMAEQQAREALAQCRGILGANHNVTAKCEEDLSTALMLQGKLDDAAPIRRQALATYRRNLGDYHPYTQRLMTGVDYLGVRYQQIGKWVEAEGLHREALEYSRRVYGNTSTQALDVGRNLSVALASQNLGAEHPRTIEAAELKENFVAYVRKSANLAVITSLNAEIVKLEASGDFSGAAVRALSVLAIAQRELGEEHATTRTARENAFRIQQRLPASVSKGQATVAPPFLPHPALATAPAHPPPMASESTQSLVKPRARKWSLGPSRSRS
jgi:tetratricopeptide (TPR) repeat protein